MDSGAIRRVFALVLREYLAKLLNLVIANMTVWLQEIKWSLWKNRNQEHLFVITPKQVDDTLSSLAHQRGFCHVSPTYLLPFDVLPSLGLKAKLSSAVIEYYRRRTNKEILLGV